MSSPDPDYNLVLPFLTNNPAFAHGVEIGRLYEEMKNVDSISGYYHIANQEQITLMANRLGWWIVSMVPWDTDPETWFRLTMHKKPV